MCEADDQLELVWLCSGNMESDWIIDVLGLVDQAEVQPRDVLDVEPISVVGLHSKGPVVRAY